MKKRLLTLWLMTLMVSFSALADDTWTIVGNNADILGSSWSETDTNNDMTNVGNNVWRLVKSVTLTDAATLQYKVVKDHDWTTNYGKDGAQDGTNIEVALEAGSYDLVFTFNDDTHALTANYSYTIVAGDASIINGNDNTWTPTATSNDMTKVNYDLYKLTVKDVELTAGDYKYKVVANHAWSVWEVPSSGDQTLIISEDGTYDIVYTLVPSTNTLTAVALKQNTYTIVGDATLVSGDGWTLTNHYNDMVKDADDVYVYTYQVTGKKIPAGTYQYKVVYNGAWWPCVPNSTNASLTIEEDGVYTIDYTLTLGTDANGSDATIAATPTKTGSATYTNNWLVAGSESLTGYDWDASGSHHVMTDNGDGTYSLSLTNVALTTDGTYEFKIVNNFYDGDDIILSKWYPDNNQTVSVLSNGNYDVTITYNPTTGDVTQNVTAATQNFTVAINDPGWDAVYAYAFTGETPVAAWPGTLLTKTDGKYTYTYNGTSAPANVIFNNGDGNGVQTPDLAFTDGTTYTDVWTIMGATQNASWADYETEPIFGTAWTADVDGNDMTPSADGKTWTWTKSGVELTANSHIKYKATYGHCGTTYVVGDADAGDGMKVLNVVIAGRYDITFTFTRNGNSFAVDASATKTAEAVTIGATGWATTVTNSPLDFSGLTESFKAYTATWDGTNKKVSLDEVADVQAETGLVLKGTEGTYYAPVIASSETAKGDLKHSSTYTFTVNDDGVDYYCYGLAYADGKAKFAKIKNGLVIPAQKAFLTISKTEAASAQEFSLFFDETTGINLNVNDNLNLDSNATMYNLAGQKVSNSYKGIVIVNGKKYINK